MGVAVDDGRGSISYELEAPKQLKLPKCERCWKANGGSGVSAKMSGGGNRWALDRKPVRKHRETTRRVLVVLHIRNVPPSLMMPTIVHALSPMACVFHSVFTRRDDVHLVICPQTSPSEQPVRMIG